MTISLCSVAKWVNASMISRAHTKKMVANASGRTESFTPDEVICKQIWVNTRLNNPVSVTVTRGQILNRVTSLIYQLQPIWTRWDYGRFYDFFKNLSTKIILFKTYFLTLSQINPKNYHFHTFFCAHTDEVESIWKLSHSRSRSSGDLITWHKFLGDLPRDLPAFP